MSSLLNSILYIGVLCGVCIYVLKKENVLEPFWSTDGKSSKVQHVMIDKNGNETVHPRQYEYIRRDLHTHHNNNTAPNISFNNTVHSPMFKNNPLYYDKLSSNDTNLKEKYNADYRQFISPSQRSSNIYKKEEFMNPNQLLPVSDMKSLNANNVDYPIIYPRHMYANKKSRLAKQGDMIRGDPPIVPIQSSKEVMFRPTVNPHIDLNKGALAVLGGIENETNRKTLALAAHGKGSKYITGSGISAKINDDMFLDKFGDVNVHRSNPHTLLNP